MCNINDNSFERKIFMTFYQVTNILYIYRILTIYQEYFTFIDLRKKILLHPLSSLSLLIHSNWFVIHHSFLNFISVLLRNKESWRISACLSFIWSSNFRFFHLILIFSTFLFLILIILWLWLDIIIFLINLVFDLIDSKYHLCSYSKDDEHTNNFIFHF